MSKPRKMGRIFWVIVSLACLSACTTIQPDPPQISLKTLEVVELNLSHALMKAELDMINPNDFDLKIEHADYKLKLNGVNISSGRSSKSVQLPANGRGSLFLDLSSSYLDLFSFLQKVKPGEPLEYQIDGNVDLGGFGFMNIPYPIHKKGVINLEGLPR